MLTCKFGGGPVWAHNRFVTGWSDCIRDEGLSCKIEPRFSYLNNENRPDIIAFGSGSGESFELDISLAHPRASEASRRSAVKDGAAASIREEKKITNYDSNIRPSGSAAKFFPIVAEHFGHWGKHACDFFSLLVSHVDEEMNSRAFGEDDCPFSFKTVTLVFCPTNYLVSLVFLPALTCRPSVKFNFTFASVFFRLFL